MPELDEIGLTTRVLRGSGPPETLLQPCLDLGFRRWVLDPEIRMPQWELLRSVLPPRSVQGVFLLAPLPPRSAKGLLPPPRLAPVDPDEAREALQRCQKCVEFASRHEIPRLIVPAQAREEPSPDDVARLLSELRPPPWDWMDGLRSKSRANRTQWDHYLRVLSPVLEAAERYGFEVAVQPAGWPSELPDAVELVDLLRRFDGAPLHVAADTLKDQRARWSRADGGEPGSHAREDLPISCILFHDGTLHEDHRVPGTGSVEFGGWTELLCRRKDALPEVFLDLAGGTTADEIDLARKEVTAIASGPSETTDEKGCSFLDTPPIDFV